MPQPPATDPPTANQVLHFSHRDGYTFELEILNVTFEEDVQNAAIGRKYLLPTLEYRVTNTTAGEKKLPGEVRISFGLPESAGELGGPTLGAPQCSGGYCFAYSMFFGLSQSTSGLATPIDGRTKGGTNNYLKVPEGLNPDDLLVLVDGYGTQFVTLNGTPVPADLLTIDPQALT